MRRLACTALLGFVIGVPLAVTAQETYVPALGDIMRCTPPVRGLISEWLHPTWP